MASGYNMPKSDTVALSALDCDVTCEGSHCVTYLHTVMTVDVKLTRISYCHLFTNSNKCSNFNYLFTVTLMS